MQDNNIPIRRKKRKRKNFFGYLFLFSLVFIFALFGLSYIVKSYSPKVDVTIGNNEALTLSEQDMDVEIKTIDERLKWIQTEDEMPTVAIREPKEKLSDINKKQKTKDIKKNTDDTAKDRNKEEKTLKKQKKDKITGNNETINKAEKDYKKQKLDLKLEKAVTPPKPLPPKVSKVYIGKYSTIEEATKIQRKIAAEETDIVPFIKSLGSGYIVQVGSFSDSQKASALLTRMKNKGYSAKLITENK